MSRVPVNLPRRAVALAASAGAVLILAIGALDARADPPPAPPPPPTGGSTVPPTAAPPAGPLPDGAMPVTSTNPSTTTPNPQTTPGPAPETPPMAEPKGGLQTANPAQPGPLVRMRLRGRVLTLTLRCHTSGSVMLTDARHVRIAARNFECAHGRAAVALTLSRAVARQSHSRHGAMVSAAVRERGARSTSVRLRLTSASARGVARASSAGSNTYCEFDSGAGIPLCYEYWLETYGPVWYPQYSRWLWAGKASRWLGGEFQGYVWFWSYWNGSAWIGYGRS
jgi:hypothetical protein